MLKRGINCLALVLLVSGTVGLPGVASMPKAAYALSKTFPIGGTGGWDYATLNAAGTLLYLTRTTHTQIVETATGKLRGDILGTIGSHGVALVPELNRGFISDGEGSAIEVFDLKTTRVLGRIPAPKDADGILYDDTSKQVIVMCGDSSVLLAVPANISLTSLPALKPLNLGGKPEFAALDHKGRAYINLQNKNQVAVVDTRSMKVVAHWPTGEGKAPTGMAMDLKKRELFVGCRNRKMIVMSADDGRLLASLPIGSGVDATAFNQGTALASCADGTLSAIQETSPHHFQVVQTLQTAPGARTMAVDAKDGTVYLPTANLNNAKPRPNPLAGTFKILVVKALR
jgi:DNA-binding beta-propeller fold protein YncE